MRIPDELSRELYKAKSAFASYEVIVRDCAKVCSDRAKGKKEQVALDAEAKECARDILASYLLEQK